MSRFVTGRLAPLAFVAILLAACTGSTEKKQPAVDPKLLQSRLEQIVDALTKSTSADAKVKAEGAVKVEAKDDGTVTGATPKLVVTGAAGEVTSIDPVTLTFTPGANADQVNVDIKIPSSVIAKDKDGKVKAEVTIGSQTIKGLWRDDLQTIDKAVFSLKDIKIAPKDEPGSAKIAEVSGTSNLTETSSGVFDVVFDGKFSGFAFDMPADKSAFKMDEVTLKGSMKGAKLKEYAVAAKEAGYTLSNPDMFKIWTTGEFDPKTLAFLKRMPEFLGAIDYGYAVRGLSATENGKETFRMGRAEVSIGLAPESADKAKARVTLKGGEFLIDDGSGKPLLPAEADVKDFTFDLETGGLPSRELWAIYMEVLPSIQKASVASVGGDTSAGEKAMNEASQAAMAKFMEALSKSTLNIALKAMDVITPTLIMGANGTGTYNAGTDLTPVGKFRFTFKGVDALMTAMEKRGKDDTMAQQIIGGLSSLKAMAKPDAATSGANTVYVIEVEGTKDGKVLVNGQDMFGAAPPPR